MRLTKKNAATLSAISLAAAAALAATTVHGATLTLYYGQDSYANSNNNVDVASGFTPSPSTTDGVGAGQYLTGFVEPQTVSQNAPTTINVAVGSYLSLAIDAVVTGNPNSDAGATGGGEPPQPAVLGLGELSVGISSTDTSATYLSPIALTKALLSVYHGTTTYFGFAKINQSQGTNGGTGPAPFWGGVAKTADVQPNEPGFDQGIGNGNFGLNGFTTGGNTTEDGLNATDINALSQFGNTTASYNNATDFEDSVMFQGLAVGTVTLAPYVVAKGSTYWTVVSNAASGFPTTYDAKIFTSSDTINNLPELIINVSPVPEPASLGLLAVGALGLMARRNRGKI